MEHNFYNREDSNQGFREYLNSSVSRYIIKSVLICRIIAINLQNLISKWHSAYCTYLFAENSMFNDTSL